MYKCIHFYFKMEVLYNRVIWNGLYCKMNYYCTRNTRDMKKMGYKHMVCQIDHLIAADDLADKMQRQIEELRYENKMFKQHGMHMC